MFKRFLEILLGLDKGYLQSQHGESTWEFNPHWPGPFIGEPGKWTNYLIGVLALALLVILLRRVAARPFHNLRLALAGAAAILAAALVPMALGAHWWSIGLLVGVIAGGIALYVMREESALMGLGRLAAGALVLMVLSGSLAWNLTLAIGVGALIIFVYRREGRTTGAKVFLGVLRAALAAFVLMLLNNPVLKLTQTLRESSVVAVLVDDSLSMQIHDVHVTPATSGPTRLEAAVDLLTGDDQALIRKLGQVHTLRFYSFNRNARSIGSAVMGDDQKSSQAPRPATADSNLLAAIKKLRPVGTSTQVIPSILTVLDELQGQRLAGVVVLTDGRDTPASTPSEAYKTLANYGVKVYPIAVGSDKTPQNIEIQAVSVQDSAFKDDIVNLRLTVRATGYEPGHAVKLKLTDKKTGLPLMGPDRHPVEKTIYVPDSKPIDEELLFKPTQVGPLDIKVEAEKQPGELNELDNIWPAQISVLDAKITVLYVEGYPRWEYRYIKNEMIRDKTVDISCILTSADPTFAQEHSDLSARGEAEKFKYFPFNQFPTSMEQLMECDVVLFGDVDPRQFADAQLQMISDFVSKKGGGFGMIAGPLYSPGQYHNTPIETLLPVSVIRPETTWPTEAITDPFRPVLTKEGAASSIFRFFPDKVANDKYVKEQLQGLFWYARGIEAKKGVGEVYAEHPVDLGPDGRKAPLLVLGRYGAGRTMFSAMDETWRWRFYTGETVFDSYWVQQLRYLARSKKLGQRDMTFTSERPVYQLGDQVHINLKVLNPTLLQQLPPEIVVQMKDEAGQTVRSEKMVKEFGQPDLYSVSFGADRAGQYTLQLPSDKIQDAGKYDQPIGIIVPRLELAQPEVDRSLLAHLASVTAGQEVKLQDARARLPDLIQSAARTLQLSEKIPLWDRPMFKWRYAPLALVIFVLLITAEWILRKVYGMV